MSLSSQGIAILSSNDRLLAAELSYDPRARNSQYALVVNHMSPLAYLRGHGNGIFFVREYLRHGIALGQAWTTLAVA